MEKFVNLRDCDVIAPNLHARYSGITSVVITIVPELAKQLAIASVGPHLSARVPRIRWTQLFTQGWSKPPQHSKRIWHARRNDEMIVGLILRDILRQPWLLTFTSTAQRDHKPFTKWLMRKMDALLAGSSKASAYLQIPAMVIDNSIETARFSPAPDKVTAWAQTGLPGKFGVGVFGRVRHQKGTDLFVEAMIRLLPKYPDFTAVIVGLCAPEQEAFTTKLEQRIAQAGLQKRIIFLGELAAQDVPLWFARLSLYVAPMRWEGFGLTPIEAMASGVAVVATTAGAHEQIVVENETGHLVPPDSLEPLITAIEDLMQNEQKQAEMGQKGREIALLKHDVAIEAARTMQAYNLMWASQALPDDRPQQ